jgi:recombination protein RecT
MNMAPTTTQSPKPNGIQKTNAAPERERTPVAVLSDIIAQKRDALAAVASANLDADRLVKLSQAALSRTPDLAKCTPLSVVTALMRCSELGLEPNATLPQRRMWLVPRWNKKLGGLECIAQIDYRAEIQLARDTGLVEDVVADVVCANDSFTFERGNGDGSMTRFTHRPILFGDRGVVIGYYAAARLAMGALQFFPMSASEMDLFRDNYGPRNREGKLTGPWASERENERRAMGLKTVLHRLWNLLPAGKNEAALRLQERLAEETQQDLGAIDAEVVSPPPAPGGTRTADVKAKLAAKLGKAPAPDTHEGDVAALDAEASGAGEGPADAGPAAETSSGSAPTEDLEVKFGKNKGRMLSELEDGDVRYLIGRWEADLADPSKSKFHANAQRSIEIGRAILSARSAGAQPASTEPGSDGEASPFND